MGNMGVMSELIPWQFRTKNQVIFNDNYTIQKTYAFTSKDTSAMTEDEKGNYLGRLNNIFKRFKTGWIFWIETQNVIDISYPDNIFSDPLLRDCDEIRKRTLSGGKNYRQIHYLTIVYKQPSDAFRKLAGLVDKDNKEIWDQLKQSIKEFSEVFFPRNTVADFETATVDYYQEMKLMEENFLEETDEIIRALSPYFVDLRPLNGEETLTYLHSCISDSKHPVKLDITAFLTAQLADGTFMTGRTPKIGNKYIGIIGIKDLPNYAKDFLCRKLDSISSEYRYVIRYLALSKDDAMKEVKTIQQQHHQRQKSPITMFWEAVQNKVIDKVDEEAVMDEEDSRDAYAELAQDNIGMGYGTINLVLLNENEKVLADELADIKAIINDLGFVAAIEKDNASQAWLSTIPACYTFGVRTYFINSTNFILWSPVSSLWEGQKENEHFKKLNISSVPLMKCETPEKLPFYLNLHVADVGHTMVAGATGTGKSVLLNTIASNFRKYENAKVFIFDKSASSRIITQALGGNFYNLLVDVDSISFQPLANVDDPIERTWACDWLCDYLTAQNLVLTPALKKLIMEALRDVGNSPLDQRTITSLTTYLQDEELREALLALSLEGAYGSLFDSNIDKFGTGDWQVFEMEKLMENANIVAPTLDYLFHRIERQLTGVPALIVLDECWLFLSNPTFRAKIVEYLKDLRKKNCSVVLATQNLSDIPDELLSVIVENTKTKIYLANDNMNVESQKIYEKFGLNETEIGIVKALVPKKEYYYKSSLGSRIFDLKLSPLEAAFYTATSKQDQLKAAELKSLAPADFVENWKRLKGVSA